MPVLVGRFSASRSKEPMKKLLSRLTGPPKVPPHCCDRRAPSRPRRLLREVGGVQLAVSEESIGAATNSVGSRFGHDVDDAADGASVFGGAAEGDDLKFLDQVLAVALLRLDERDVKVVEAIDEQRAFFRPRAADRDTRSIRRTDVLGSRRRQQREIEVVTISTRQRLELFAA